MMRLRAPVYFQTGARNPQISWGASRNHHGFAVTHVAKTVRFVGVEQIAVARLQRGQLLCDGHFNLARNYYATFVADVFQHRLAGVGARFIAFI